MFGMLNYEFGLVCALISGLGSLIGTFIIQKLLEKTNRPSILVFVLFAVLLVSTILIPANALYQIMDQLKQGRNIWNFDSPC